ncbi:unnamed protein product [Clonostachys rhizophaga]|uniref:PNPLA domain-containing protein n=1 Tax=Clonostachys rhizophaga TaxID=160324 RepID=A0A9N9VA43_9HYPO|nr:unnamed protein product [Clonostachys rhizophaga]
MAEISILEPRVGPDGDQPHSQSPLKPCDYFDLICGTSTGGLIALLLNRLEYTAKEAIDEYFSLGKEIFNKKLPWYARGDATYDDKVFENCLRNIVKTSPLGGKDARLKDERRCRTFVVSTDLDRHCPGPIILRSYDIGSREPASTVTILQAGRATSAAPTFFKPILIGNHKYSDGGTVANNPSHHAIMEAGKIWELTDIDCITSLGTGPEGDHTLENATKKIMGRLGGWALQRILLRLWYLRLQLALYSVHAMTGTEHTHYTIKQKRWLTSFAGSTLRPRGLTCRHQAKSTFV